MKGAIIILFLSIISSFPQSDSLLQQQKETEDLLPIGNENAEIDYPEEEQIFTLQLRSRYLNSSSGLSPKIYNRFKTEYSKISAGILTEKDAGEKSFTDFYSYYIAYKDTGFIRDVIIGNYLFSFGCGVSSGSSYKVFKTSDPFYPLNNNMIKLKGYNSSDENKYYRGAIVKAAYNNFNLFGFYSDNRFDAGIDTNGVITYIPVSGTHITSTEILRKKTAGIKTIGFSSGYKDNIFSAALLYTFNKSDHLYSKSISLMSEYSNLSLFINVPLNKDIYLSGESSSDLTNMNNIIILNIKPSERITYISSVRLYKKKYSSFYSGAFSESGGINKDENGFFNGCRIKVKPFTFDLFYDFFNVGGITSSYRGSEFMLKGEYALASKSYLKIKYRVKESFHYSSYADTKRNISMELGIPVSMGVSYRVKGEFIKAYHSGLSQSGGMLYNSFLAAGKSYTAECRLTIFQCLSYYASLYQYERDAPGYFSSKILTGEGSRWFVYLSYKLPWDLIITLKYASVNKKTGSIQYLNVQTDYNL